MEKIVARLNIEHFRRKLNDEADETTRQTLLRLLTEEEAKLAHLTNRSSESNRSAPGRIASR
jgi:hypothetical protein